MERPWLQAGAQGSGGPLGVDGIISTSVRAFTANIFLMLGLAIALVGGPALFVILVAGGTAEQMTPVVAFMFAMRDYAPLLIAGAVLMVIGVLVLQAAYTYIVIQFLANQKVSFEEAARFGLKRIGSVLLIGILSILGIMLGSLLFIVPGIILSIVWYVAIPVFIAEDCGATDSLSRSAALTDGYRWPVFGLVLVVGLISAVISWISTLVTAAVPMAGIPIEIIINIVTTAFGAIVPAVTYHRLITIKEGAQSDDVASVFD
jgi:hypothetical protein